MASGPNPVLWGLRLKLSDNQIAAVRETVGAEPIPEDNPAMEPLKQNFGDHTFYVDNTGLLVLEPVNDPNQPGEPAAVIHIAAWTDEERKQLQPIEPKASGAVLDLAPAGPANGADGTAA